MPFKAEAKRNHPKRWYQDRWCVKYFDPSEVMISDIHDCVSDTHVIEFDFADHWYESIGESLHYAMQTGKKAGIVLIIENDGELKYWIKLNDTIKHYRLPIDTWYTSP
jgi:hypothetical protein